MTAPLSVGLALLLGLLLAVAWLTSRVMRDGALRGTPLGRATLRVIAGPRAGSEVSLAGEVTTLGSAEDNTLVLGGPEIARRHAAIRMGSLGYLLADLGAPNGVHVNGVRVGKRLLAPGDVIRIGAAELMFYLEKVG